MENIQVWVSTMTSSKLRSFRHTATVISLTMLNGLCDAAKALNETTAQMRRQLETERKRKGANTGRLSTFKRNVEEGEAKSELARGTIKDLFDTVFVHRYRDVDARIRTECIEALGYWVITLPDVFFDAEYFRYFGWVMSDTSAPTRHEVIKQLQKLFKNKENIGGLRHFIDRFRPRLVEIATRDSESAVRASAVELVDKIREAGMLEPDDIDVVGKLIFDSEARVRKAVTGFFAANIQDLYDTQIEELGGGEALESLARDENDFDQPRVEWVKLKCLAQVLASYDTEDSEIIPSQATAYTKVNKEGLIVGAKESRFSLAAETLFENIKELHSWEMLAGYLLFDNSKPISDRTASRSINSALMRACQLEEKEETILLEILNTTVKLSLTQAEDLEKGKDKNKKKTVSRMESLQIKESTARNLAALIPKLLRKFGSQPQSAISVLRLEHHLNLTVFQELRQDSTTYASLLDDISRQFSSHDDDAVLDEAGAALLHARKYEELEEITEDKVQGLWADSLQTFQALASGMSIGVRGSLDVDHLTSLSRTVRRISKLACISNCVEVLETVPARPSKSKVQPIQPINALIQIVDRGILTEASPEIDSIEDDLVTSAIRSTLFYFMWKMISLKQAVKNSLEIPDRTKIKERQWNFIKSMTDVFSSRANLDDLRLSAVGSFLDLHTLFSTLGASAESASSTGISTLVPTVTEDVQAEITSIFVIAEKNLAKKANKRLEAPADDDEPEDIEDDPEDDEDEDLTDSERKAEALHAEQRLCELTGKIALAIIAGVIDASGPSAGKLRKRLVRNRSRLGPNFKEVVAFLDDPKEKSKKKIKAPNSTSKPMKSLEIVDEADDDEHDDEDPFAEEPEEGSEEDLRRRGLLDDDAPVSVDLEAAQNVSEDEDEIMGD
jgi:cohesin complex subunit SA-1/2